jgi:Zn-dependent M28 family amino/carboxypeptidase
VRTTAAKVVTATFAATTVFAAGATVPAAAGPHHHQHHDSYHHTSKHLTRAVTLPGVVNHLEAFQRIADRYGDRAAGRPGYKKSVRYVVKKLKRAGYRPQVQRFEFPYIEDSSVLERVSPDPTAYTNSEDFLRNGFDTGTPQGDVTGALVPVDLRLDAPDLPPDTSSSGCEPEDFADFAAGSIALMQRGTCGFAVKALNAEAAGAAGAIIMNEGQPGRRNELISMTGDATGLTIPVVYATFDTGADLAATPGASVRVNIEYLEETRNSYNVLAETRKGRRSNVVMAGAHLDGVQDGAGSNDNGSGSAALLETAIQMAKLKVKPRNAVRFAWWGAEEEGLLGSEYYVSQLSERAVEKLALYLNFDMVASPNYMLGVYDGDESEFDMPDGFVPEGSAAIERVFQRWYARNGIPFTDTEFSGRSDYGPFIEFGVPAGGLFTGAEDPKTEEDAALFGGVVGASFDPCYHQACDNLTGEGQDADLYAELEDEYNLIGNVNTKALRINADAIANAVVKFAFSTWSVNETRTTGKQQGTKPSTKRGAHAAHGKAVHHRR